MALSLKVLFKSRIKLSPDRLRSGNLLSPLLAISALAGSASAQNLPSACEGFLLPSASVGKRALEVDPLFGPEFTFTNQHLLEERKLNPDQAVGFDQQMQAYDLWKVHAIADCLRAEPPCRVVLSQDKHGVEAFRVEFQDGWYFQVATDVGVLEVTTQPLREKDFAKRVEQMEQWIFKRARSLDLEAHSYFGGGHIHIDLKPFLKHPVLFQDFLVDLANRPELTTGVLGGSLVNAPPLSAMSPQVRENFQKMLDRFEGKEFSLEQLVARLHSDVYTESTTVRKKEEHSRYFQVLRLFDSWEPEFGESRTLEVRSFRGQPSAQIFYLQIRLLRRWLNHLASKEERISFQNRSGKDFTERAKIEAFAALLEELELDWAEFRPLVPQYLNEAARNFEDRVSPR